MSHKVSVYFIYFSKCNHFLLIIGVTFSTLSGEFSQGTTLSCHNVTVVDNNFAERDGTISLRIQNATLSNVNVSTTDVAVEDNDGKLIVVDLLLKGNVAVYKG